MKKKSGSWAESSRWGGGNFSRKLKMVGFTKQVVGRQQLGQKVTE